MDICAVLEGSVQAHRWETETGTRGDGEKEIQYVEAAAGQRRDRGLGEDGG